MKYRIINVIFNVSKDYKTLGELEHEIGISYPILHRMIQTGEVYHGYVLDEL